MMATVYRQSGARLYNVGYPAEAEIQLRESAALTDLKAPAGDLRYYLGSALLAQKKYAEAEPLLLRGYDELTRQPKTITNDVLTKEAAKNLATLYDALNQPQKADEWRKK
jgi:hypothetical protein